MRLLKAIMLPCLCGSAVLLAAFAAEPKPPDAIQRLLSKDFEEVKQARNEIVAARRKLIARLLEAIEDPKNRLSKFSSVDAMMFVLGEMRAAEAVDTLVRYIGYPMVGEKAEPFRSGVVSSRFMLGNPRFNRNYPAVDALVKIGEPSVGPATKRLLASQSEQDVRLCLGVLVWLRSSEQLTSQFTEFLAQETDPRRQAALKLALRLVANESVSPEGPTKQAGN